MRTSYKKVLLPRVADYVVIEGTNKWIGMVAKYNFCPFVNLFGLKRELVVEHSLDPETLVQHSMRLLDNKNKNTMMIILPSCPLPDKNTDFSSVSPQLVASSVMDPVLGNFRDLLADRHLRWSPTNLEGPITDVVFNPFFFGTANWSPWPVIQLVKSSVMEQAGVSYEKSRSKASGGDGGTVADITRDNQKKAGALRDREYCSDVVACYGGTMPTFYTQE